MSLEEAVKHMKKFGFKERLKLFGFVDVCKNWEG